MAPTADASAPPAAQRCATCGAPVDPLRAARVAIFFERFQYFCSAECRERYQPEATATPMPLPRHSLSEQVLLGEPTEQAAPVAQAEPDEQHSTFVAAGDERPRESVTEVRRSSVPPERPHPASLSEGTLRRIHTREISLLRAATVAAGLGVALALLGDLVSVFVARALLFVGAIVCLTLALLRRPRDAAELPPALLLLSPAAGLALLLLARWMHHDAAGAAAMLCGASVVATAGSLWLLRPFQVSLDNQRLRIAKQLDVVGRRVDEDNLRSTLAGDLRPGEEIVVEENDVLPVDVRVIAGTAQIRPWLHAQTLLERSDGDPIAAGAQVVEGRLRAVVMWTGLDRAWSRLTNDPARRADLHAPLCRLGQLLAWRGSLGLALVAALAFGAAGDEALWVALYAVAGLSALALPGPASIAALQTARGILAGLNRGVVFRSAGAFHTAGHVTQGVFCARGTLLLGEPEVASIDAFGNADTARVLALAAGAESGALDPSAVAIQRAARAHQVRPDGSRSHTPVTGLGITAVASTGEPLILGSRALMLKERISVAAAEKTIADLEAQGRTVFLVALGGHLVGILGLQDGLRAGARAAVQHLLDVGIEPVLLSGDSRQTCEALGRAVDIDHVRPEILPADRGKEIQRLADSGAIIAVIGRSPTDDGSLNAAHVSVVLDMVGPSGGDWDVQLVSTDVRDAAFALRLAHRTRLEARRGLVLCVTPAAIGCLLVVLGGSVALAAGGGLIGTILAAMRYRAVRVDR